MENFSLIMTTAPQ